MAWKHPRENIRNNDVPSVEPLNRNFADFDEEIGGRLNEHNWAASGFNDATHFADDIAIRLYHAYTESDGGDDPSYGAVTPGEFLIPHNSQWSAALSKSFTAVGGMIWVMASFQLQSEELGVQCVLRINGTIDPDSLWPYGDGEVERQELDADDAFARRAPGETNTLVPVLVETLTSVPPGECTVELVARTTLEDRFPSTVTTREKYAIYHRELIILELLDGI